MNYNQVELGEHFQSILDEKSRLIYISNSLGEAGSEGRSNWERYLELEELIKVELGELYKGNPSNIACSRTFDIIHDTILCNDKTIINFPKNYKAYIICSVYNSIFRYYRTSAVITTPKKEQFLISVPTDVPYKVGEFIPK